MMRVIIAGASGFVGGGLVRQCIANDKISHAFVLTRKPLPEELTTSAKVTVILHEDFSSYPTDLLKQLSGAEGCLWAIGGKVSAFPDVETTKKVSVDFTLAAANAFLSDLSPQLPEGTKFRFVFCSGEYAEWDQNKSLMFLQDTRRIKGQVEKGLCDLADANPERFEVWCVRPGGILPTNAGFFLKSVAKPIGAIGVDHLAAAMVQILLEGFESRIVEKNVLLKF